MSGGESFSRAEHGCEYWRQAPNKAHVGFEQQVCACMTVKARLGAAGGQVSSRMHVVCTCHLVAVLVPAAVPL